MHSPAQLLEMYEQKFSNTFNNNPTSLYQPVNHIMSIKGKRIRPLLLLIANDMFGGNVQQALFPAYAMEVFHNFTLVHDDIMDNADIRRGEPTVHKKYGLNAGILAGDVMLAYTYKYLTDIPVAYVQPVLQLFNKTAIEIFEGQQTDIDFESRNDVAEAEYLKMIEYKTSVLLACSLQTGAILAGASLPNQQLVYDFGLNLGLSFQIKDDYLDSFGESAKVGKRIGGDILQNKKTLLYITAVNSADADQKKQFEQLRSETDEEKKIAAVKALYEQTGARQKVLDKAESLYRSSLNKLQQVDLPETQKAVLFAMAEKVNSRDY